MTDLPNARERDALDAWSAVEPPDGFAGRVLAARDDRRRKLWLGGAGGIVAAAAVAAIVVTRPLVDPVPPQPSPPAVAIVQSPAAAAAGVQVYIGDSVTIHDSEPATSVQFVIGARCAGKREVELYSRTTAVTRRATGSDTVTIDVPVGTWDYTVSCLYRPGAEVERRTIAFAPITVVRDAYTYTSPPGWYSGRSLVTFDAPGPILSWTPRGLRVSGTMLAGWRRRGLDNACRADGTYCRFGATWSDGAKVHALVLESPDSGEHYFVLRAPGTVTPPSATDYDVRVEAGESVTIHEPRDATRIGWRADSRCDHEFELRMPGHPGGRVHSEHGVAVAELGTDSTIAYEVKCDDERGAQDPLIYGGITVLHDDAHAPVHVSIPALNRSVVFEEPALDGSWTGGVTAKGRMAPGWRQGKLGRICPADGPDCNFAVGWKAGGNVHVLDFIAPDGGIHYFVLRAPGT